MTDQVQQLIDKIRHDAVQAASKQAEQVLADARAEAERIVGDAHKRATDLTRQAEKQAKDLHERGAQTLRLAARDLLLAVGQQLEGLVETLIGDATDKVLNADVIEQMLLLLAKGFAENGVAEGQIEVAVGPQDRERMQRFAMAELRHKLEQGVNLRFDNQLGAGFKLSYANNTVHHDFTAKAIAETLAQVVRPQLAEIVLQAALMQGGNQPALTGKP